MHAIRSNRRRPAKRLVLLALVLAGLGAPVAAAGLDVQPIARARFGNDSPRYVDRIPSFESADARIDAVYYYRGAVFRARQRDLGADGFISTEFLNDIGWLRDRRYAHDYIAFMYARGNDRHFTEYMADSVYGRFLVDGDRAGATRHLAAM